MGDARRERVIEIKHVTGGGGKRDVGQQVVPRRTRGPGGGLLNASARARQPVGEGRSIRGVAARASAVRHRLKASPRPRARPCSVGPERRARTAVKQNRRGRR